MRFVETEITELELRLFIKDINRIYEDFEIIYKNIDSQLNRQNLLQKDNTFSIRPISGYYSHLIGAIIFGLTVGILQKRSCDGAALLTNLTFCLYKQRLYFLR